MKTHRPLTAVISLFAALALMPAAMSKPLPDWSAPDISKAPAELEAQWQQLTNIKPGKWLGIRGIFRFAYEASALGWHPERVEHALAYARTLQDLDPGSKTYGNFSWYTNQPKPVDLNAVEFVSQIMGLLYCTHLDKLTPKAREDLTFMMTHAIKGMENHPVRIQYTNIWLKKIWCLVSLGEALGRTDVAADGYKRLDDWLAFTAQNGIGEYNAVTYYGTDLDSLCMIAKYAERPEGRAAAERAMRYLWTNAAAVWWSAGDRIGGANARSYDYLYGHGYFEAFTWTAGWLREKPQIENAGWIGSNHDNLVAFRNAVHMPVPREWTEPILSQIPRTVVQRWGAEPERTATAWIGRHASLATSGAGYSREDRALVANIGNSPDIPQITMFMDGRGDPFGTKKVAGKDNHAKALHLEPFIATVQRGPEALQLLSCEPVGPKSRHKPGDLACFLTQLTIPAKAEIWIGGKKVRPGTTSKPLAVPAGATIGFRVGDAAAAIRILFSDTTNGAPAAIEIVEDSKKLPARRLTIIHDENDPRGRASTVVWMRVADNLDEAGFAKFMGDFAAAEGGARKENNIVYVSAAGLHGPMRIEADIAKQRRVALEGGEPRPALLSVNGREVGLPVFDN